MIPKTTKLTLKRIVENLGRMPEKELGQETPKLSSDQKKRLMEMASMFENYGHALNNEEAIMNSAKAMTELCELAEAYALNECGDWFQQDIVKRDMKEVKKRVMEYGKLAKESYAKMQQLGVAYQDIGHVLGRYYDLKKKDGTEQAPQKLTESPEMKEWTDTDFERKKEASKGERKIPSLSPEQEAQAVSKFNSLSPARRVLLRQILKHSCYYCESEFNLPNVGSSHGICERHKEEVYKTQGLGKPVPNTNNPNIDLANLSQDERNLLVDLYAALKTKAGLGEPDTSRITKSA